MMARPLPQWCKNVKIELVRRDMSMRRVWITVCAYWQTMAASSMPSALRAT